MTPQGLATVTNRRAGREGAMAGDGTFDGRISFRRVERPDLPLLHRWLNEPGVVRWWEGDDVSPAAVERAHGPPPAGRDVRDDGTWHFLALLDREAVGWIQCCDLTGDKEAAAWFATGLPASTGGIDYLVGDPARRGQGIGSAMIAAFVDDVVFAAHPGWTHVAADPAVANVASWRALARAGFRHVDDIDSAHGPCRLMARAR